MVRGGARTLSCSPFGRIGLTEPEEDTSPQLRRLSEEVGRIARALAELSESGKHAGPERRVADRREGDRRELPDRRAPIGDTEMPSISSIRAMIRTRRMRDQYFSGELFADPAWDMLLDLLLARLEQRTVAVSSLCIAAAVPPTTALRWIKRLTDEGIFVRTADPRDGRRVFIDLSDQAADAMANYIRAVERIGVTLP
jgi:DNA-binding transcriptional ArsR family regulator